MKGKNRFLKKIVGMIVTIALVVGLMPGFSLTAYADTSDYNLWVGGVAVTSSNKDNITTGASYDSDNHKLILNGFSYSGAGYIYNGDAWPTVAAGIYYEGAETLTIEVRGNNSINRTGGTAAYSMHSCAIFSRTADLIFKGTGSLEALYTKFDENKIYGGAAVEIWSTTSTVTIESGTFNFYGPTPTSCSDTVRGVNAGKLVVNDGEVYVLAGDTSGESGANSYGVGADVVINDGLLNVSSGVGNNSYAIDGTLTMTGGKCVAYSPNCTCISGKVKTAVNGEGRTSGDNSTNFTVEADNFIPTEPGSGEKYKSIILTAIQTPITYMDWDSSNKRLVSSEIESYKKIKTTSSEVTWGEAGETSWYVLTDNAILSNKITAVGTVNLVICDGKTLTINGADVTTIGSAGIILKTGNTINIYGQSGQTGKIRIVESNNMNRGIGPGGGNIREGTLCINGAELYIEVSDYVITVDSMTVNAGVVNIKKTGTDKSAILNVSLTVNGGEVFVDASILTSSGVYGISAKVTVNGGSVTSKVGEGSNAFFIYDDRPITLGEGMYLYGGAAASSATLRLEGQGDYTGTGYAYMSISDEPPYKALTTTAPTVSIIKGDGNTVEGTPQIGDTLTAVPNPSNATPVTYQWYRGTTAISGATSNEYTVVTADNGKKLHVVVTQAANSGGSGVPASAITATSADTAVVQKKDGPAAPILDETEFTPDYAAETFTVGADYEVSSTNGTTATVVSNLTAALDSDAHKIYIRKKATDDTAASAWLEVTLTERPAAPTGLSMQKASDQYTEDGLILDTTDQMEYKLKSSTGGWTDASNDKTMVKSGVYLVRFKAVGGNPAGKAYEIIVGANLPPIELNGDQKPTAVTGLEDNGNEQELVNEPEGDLPSGYTMYYDLGTEAAPYGNWTTDIPKKKDPGIYYVWFKAVGESESVPECIEVKIKKESSVLQAGYEQTIPVLEEVTSDTIVIKEVTGFEYSIDGNTWQTKGRFEGLDADKDYVIRMRKSGEANELATLAVTTTKSADVTTDINREDVDEEGVGFIRTETRIDSDAPVGGIEKLTTDTVKAILNTDADGQSELNRVRTGETMLVYLKVTNAENTAPQEDKELIDDTARNQSNASVGMYLDMSLYKKIGDDEPTKITDLKSNHILVSVGIPEDLRVGANNGDNASVLSDNTQEVSSKTREFYIARVHEGVSEIIDDSWIDGDNIYFETDKFSTYALLYADIDSEEEKQPTAPETSDRIYTVVKAKTFINRYFNKYGESGYKYRFKVEDKEQRKAMRVSRKGKLRVKKVGKATVSLFRKANGGAWTKVEERTFISEEPDIPKKVTDLKVGDVVYALNFVKNKDEMKSAPYKFYSSKPSVATVDMKTGRINVLKSGNTKISIVYGDNEGTAVYKVRLKIK